MIDPYEVPKEERNKLIYEARKKLSFEEWKKLEGKARDKMIILAIIFIVLVFSTYYCALVLWEKRGREEDFRITLHKIAIYKCEEEGQKYISSEIYRKTNVVAVYCSAGNFLLGEEDVHDN